MDPCCLGPPPWWHSHMCHRVVGSLIVGWAGSWPSRLHRQCPLGKCSGTDFGICSWISVGSGGKEAYRCGLVTWAHSDLGSHPNLALFGAGEDALGLLLGVPVWSQSEVLPGSKWAGPALKNRQDSVLQRGTGCSRKRPAASGEMEHRAWEVHLLMLPEGSTGSAWGRGRLVKREQKAS